MLKQKVKALLCALLLAGTTGCGSFSKPSDESIVTGIQSRMFSDPVLKAAPISVTAKDGVVTLAGALPDQAARQSAQNIARETPGVVTFIDETTLPAQQSAAAPLPSPPADRPRPAAALKPARPKPLPARVPEPATDSEPAPDAAPPVTSTDVIVPAAPAADPGPIAKADAVVAPAPPPAAPPRKPVPVTVTVPEGTVLSVRTIDSIDSKRNNTGETFKASLDAPVVVDHKVVVPKDLNVILKLVNAESAGRMAGRSELTVSLESFTYQGRTYQIASSDVQQKGASRGKRSAAVIGGGAVLGALIGGIAGGGKGAAIGAAAGGGSGTAIQALTKGEQVKIAPETKLDFTLHQPLAVTYVPSNRVAPPAPSPRDAPEAHGPEGAAQPPEAPSPTAPDQPAAPGPEQPPPN